MDCEMGLDDKFGKMEQCITENSEMITSTGTESWSILMETNMKVNGLTIRATVQGLTYMQTVPSTQVNGKTTNSMVMAKKSGQMDLSMMDSTGKA